MFQPAPRVPASALLLLGAILSQPARPAQAQNQNQSQPDAPGTTPPPPATPAKPIFALPSGSLIQSPSHLPLASSAAASPPSTPDVAEECYAPAEGLYAPQPKSSSAVAPQMRSYVSIAEQRVSTMWFHGMPRAANDPWLKRAMVTVRFAILPDGTTDIPLITVSSGRASYDTHAVEAIRQASPFDPLPRGVTLPVRMCIHFGYHADPDDLKPKPRDPLPYPAAPKTP